MSKIIKFEELLSYKWLKASGVGRIVSLSDAFFKNWSSKEVKELPFFREFFSLHFEVGLNLISVLNSILFDVSRNLLVFVDRSLALDEKTSLEISYDPARVEKLLLSFLELATRTWRSSPVSILILYKIVYPALNMRFGEYEFWMFEFWLGSILAINELINLLFSMNSCFVFKALTSYEKRVFAESPLIQPKTIFSESLNLPKNFNNLSKDYFMEILFENLKAETSFSFVDMAYAFIQQDKRFSVFLSDDKASSVEKLIFSYLNKLSLDTLRFLYLNKLFTIADLKHFAKVATAGIDALTLESKKYADPDAFLMLHLLKSFHNDDK